MRAPMKTTKHDPPPTPPALSHEELVIINNALNEVCNGVSFDDDEFQTRIGYPRETAQRLLKRIGKALGQRS
jgi:hypothetical protein